MIILEIYIDWQEAFKTVHLLGNDYEIKLLYLYFYLKLNFLNWFFLSGNGGRQQRKLSRL